MDNRDKRFIRSPKDIEKVIKHAKLSNEELSIKTQTVFFSSNFKDKDNIKLLELDDYLLEEIKNNRPLVLKGEGKQNVVLCSSDKTYDLREAEVSNSLLLIPDLELFENSTSENNNADREIIRKDVIGIFNSYIEPKVCAPRFEVLYAILSETVYKGPENEYSYENVKLYTYDELLSKTQASNAEFKNALIKYKALKLDGKIRMLDFEYHFRVLSYMLDLIQENSWQLDEINKEESVKSLAEIAPTEIVEQLFELHTEPSKLVNQVQLYKYNETSICRNLAEALLKSSGKLVLNDFLQAWKESVPEGMEADEEMLNGLAVIDRESTPNCVWLMKEDDLPENINERFQILFKSKEYWRRDQIIPYIQRLETPKLDVNLMLTKYARGITVNGNRLYVAKHGR